jgi:hypothetical protein
LTLFHHRFRVGDERVIRRALVVTFFITLILTATAAFANPTWAREWGLDLWNLPSLHHQAAVANEEARDLDTQSADLRNRIAVKEALVSGLIAGRLTLAETAAEFAVLNQSFPNYMTIFRDVYSGETDDEKNIWNVIDYARTRLALFPVWERMAVLLRLDCEFQQLVVERTRHPRGETD